MHLCLERNASKYASDKAILDREVVTMDAKVSICVPTYNRKDFLPKLLIKNDVDIFIHDSLHTRTHMLFEYNCARALMRPNAVIISHDILWNKAFFSFIASHNLKGIVVHLGPKFRTDRK